MKTIIQIKDLKKSFGKKEVLKGINLEIKEGERIAILGGNGAGKTTLVEIIAQTSKQTSGDIQIDIPGNLKKEIGIQFQNGEWPAGISANDMIQFYKAMFPNFTDEWEKKLNSVFEIDEFRKRHLNRLSGGQKQRFNAMISVLNNPKIVILDELTTGLDMLLQFKIIEFYKTNTANTNQTLILVSHSPEEVELLCERMIIIHKGLVGFDQPVKEVVNKYGSVRKAMDLYFAGGLI
ncbi:ABC transporter ATP-binding protein [Williamsoniiplasma somnilux]|uniref:ABC transporter ATP-binding protein n=1 Tax=Williamsoniiplasma somnilux TaxID=215578 RepID=A0A2K8NXG4_9MOLU|nr:ABC transporter ATP-binding protein [Williamsoniiplasma somnilux]ATZ18477.1 ABC transporter ATP-binding protein [Williamsoniiplasma somnilux]